MKIRLLLALVGVAIGLALPTFAQRTNTPDPEVRQQIEAARLDIEQLRREGTPHGRAAARRNEAVEQTMGCLITFIGIG